MKLIRASFNILVLTAVILFPSILAADTAPHKRYDFDYRYADKLFSGRLLKSIDDKLNTGAPTSSLFRVYFFLEYAPSPDLIEELAKRGAMLDVDRYTTPVGKQKFGITSGKIIIDSLNSVIALEEIKKIGDAEARLFPQNNIAGKLTGADSINAKGFSGGGVTIGIFDSGLDISSQNSELPDNILALDYSDPDNVDFDVYNKITGHGTHVTGVALGRGFESRFNEQNGGGSYNGTAPKAELGFFKIAPDSSKSASDASIRAAVVDAVNIYKCDVLSISYGEYGVYRDGTSALEQTLNWAAVNHNTPVFVSAGNSGQDSYHTLGTVNAGDTTDFIRVTAYKKGVPLDFNLLWSGGDGSSLKLLYYNNLHEPFDTVHRYPVTESDIFTASAISQAASSLTATNGIFFVRVVNESQINKDYHIYKYSKGEVHFDIPVYSHLTLKPSNADYVFSVGAYTSRNEWRSALGTRESYPQDIVGKIADFSAPGPRIDGYLKPDAVAPGRYIITLRDRRVNLDTNTSWVAGSLDPPGKPVYYVTSGTSFAAPHVAGIAAVMKERFGAHGVDTIYDALRMTASRDNFTGDTENSLYGYGKINAVDVQNFENLVPYIETLPFEKNMFCMGDSINIGIELRGEFEQDNIFEVEISDYVGNFYNSVSLGKFEGSSFDTLRCKLPQYMMNSDKYRIRVKSSKPETVGSNNGSDIVIEELPNVGITGLFDVCEGEIYQYAVAHDTSAVFEFEIENGEVVQENDFDVAVKWNTGAKEGKLSVIGEKKKSACADASSYDVVIRAKPDIFLVGDSIICSEKTYRYVTHVGITETARWYVSNGTVKTKTDNSIEVIFDDYLNGYVELTVDNDTCDSRIIINTFNISGEASELYGEKRPVRKLEYEYSVDSIPGVKTFWTVKGGEVTDSAYNYLKIRWEDEENAHIIIRRESDECDAELFFNIDVRDEHKFDIDGADTVCSEAIEVYEITPFDKTASFTFGMNNGEIIQNDGDSLIVVQWGESGTGFVEVRKEIPEIGYDDLSYKYIQIIDKHGASISKIGGNDGFCVNHDPYELTEGQPEGGYYYGEGVKDGYFHPNAFEGGETVTIFYVWKDGVVCPDTVSVEIELYEVPDMPELLDYDDYLFAHGETGIFNWYRGDTLIETGNAKHVPAKTGYYSVSSVNLDGCESRRTEAIYKEVESGISEDISSLRIYPNPTDNTVNIEYTGASLYGITIFDYSSNLLFEQENCTGKIEIDTREFASGTYFIKIQTEERSIIRRFVVEK
jgi:subtilisin family serine protease